mgnify:CR=1 FL=1
MVKVLHAADFHLDSAFGALPEENAHRLHEAGVEINIWTCDSPEVAEKYIGYGAGRAAVFPRGSSSGRMTTARS